MPGFVVLWGNTEPLCLAGLLCTAYVATPIHLRGSKATSVPKVHAPIFPKLGVLTVGTGWGKVYIQET